MTRSPPELIATVQAQRLRLLDNGYRITPIRNWGGKGEGKAPYLNNWQNLVVTTDDVPAWYKSTSTGIVCGKQFDGSHLVAVDIDILDAELALEIEQQTRDMLGDNSLLRIGRAPKRLLLYRCAFAATKLHFAEGGIELLGEGNQFVAFGIHPDTRRPYEWPTGESPENTPLDAVPETTPERMAAFVLWLERRLTRLGAARDPLLEGQHDDQPIVAGEDGLVRDGRERLLRDIVWRAFHDALPNPTLEGITGTAWAAFRQRAFLGDGKWKLRDCTAKVRVIMRRWKAGEIGQDDPAPGPHWPQQPEIDAKELSRRIDADLDDFASGKSMALTYPPGSGKTTKAIRAASHMEGRTLVAMPTRRLTAEHAERVQRSDDVPVATIFGRSRDNCANHPVVEAAAERGINIDTTVCAHCPMKVACRSTPGQYYKQFDTNAATVLLSSAYLARELPKRLGEIARVVIDEMPDFVGFNEMPLSELLNTRAHGFNEKRDADVVELLEQSQKARNALEARDLSKLDPDTCEAMASREWKFKAKVPALGGLDSDAQLAALARMPIDHAPRLSSFWKALAENVRRGALATMWTGTDKETGRKMVRWNYLKRPVLPEGVPVLLLDGTVHPEIARAAFGPELEIRTAAVRRNLTVIQVADVTVSKRYLAGSERDDQGKPVMRKTVLPAIRRFAEALGAPVIGNKQFDAELGSAAHFGGLRGLNALENEAALAVVGHLQLPPVEAERIAMLLWPDKPIQRTGHYERQIRGYRMRDGSRRGVKVDVHPDPLVQAVVEHFREGNTIQAADRLRAIHQTDKLLVLCDNVPVDLTVDRLVTMAELLDPLAVMALRGVIPANPTDLAAAHPDLFPSYEQARHWTKEAGGPVLKLGEIPISTSIGIPPSLVPVTYRLASGGYTRTAWVHRARVPDPRAWLEARLGPLAYFEASGHAEAPPDLTKPNIPGNVAGLADLAAISDGTATAGFTKVVLNSHPIPAVSSGGTVAAAVLAEAASSATPEFLQSIKEAAPEFLHSIKDPVKNGPGGLTVEFPRNTRASGEAFGAKDLADATGCIMSDTVRDQIDALQRSGFRQEQIARLAGISRTTLANAKAKRYALSVETAQRLQAALASIPPPAQGALL